MSYAWIVILISASTDMVIAFIGALLAAMVDSARGELPSWSSLLIAFLAGGLAGVRTIQQYVKTLIPSGPPAPPTP